MIFDSIMKAYLQEADNLGDDDPNQTTPQNAGGEDDGGDEYNVTDPDDGGDDNTDTQDAGTEDNTTEGEDTTENQDDNTDTEGEDEYNVTDPDEEGADDNQDNPDEGEGEDDGGDEYNVTDPDEGGDDNTDDTSSTENTDDPSAKLKELEKSIFDQLSDEMKAAKTTELKKLYTDTYDKCQSIIDTISGAEKQPNQVKVYDYILNNLLDLQRYIKDYLSNIFDSKTYIENMTELQKYLAILDTVNGVFEDMSKETNDDTVK